MNSTEPPMDSNPYTPPQEAAANAPRVGYVLPPLHWVRTVGLFLVLLFLGLPTYGMAWPFAFAILFGGLRTGLIYQGCEKAAHVPPSYLGSTVVSAILCFVFQIVSAVTFMAVCAVASTATPKPLPEWVVIAVTSVSALLAYGVLFMLSIKIAIASRPRA